MNRLKRENLRAFAWAAAVVFAFAVFASAAGAQTVKKAPSFGSVRDIEGTTYTRSSFRDRYTLLLFFSIYSRESKDLIEFARSVDAEGRVDAVAVNIDPSADDVRAFLRKNPAPNSVILDLSLKLSGAFKVRKAPTVYLIGPDLKVIYASEGFNASGRKKLFDLMRGIGKKNNGATTPKDDTAKKFEKKQLVSPDAVFADFAPGRRQLVLYITSGGDLLVFNPAGGKRTQIASKTDSAAWSPAGDSIVYSLKDKPGLWVRDMDDSEAVRITPIGKKPRWSPDGAFIAFSEHSSEVWVFNVEGKRRWRVPVDGTIEGWSGDGKLLMIKGGPKVSLISPWAKMSVIEALHN